MIQFFLKFSVLFLIAFFSRADTQPVPTQPIPENDPHLYVERMQAWVNTYFQEGTVVSNHLGTSGQEIEIAYAQVTHTESDRQKKEQRKCVFIIQGLMDNYLLYARLMKKLFEHGYDVVSFDLRSQGHSDRTIADEQKIHIEDFQSYVDDVKTVYQKTIEDVYDNVYVYSHSTGGLILQELLRQEPHFPFQKVVMAAPLIGFNDRVADTVSTRPQKCGVGCAACLLGERPLTLRTLHSLGYKIYAANNCFTKFLQRKIDPYLQARDIKLDAQDFSPTQEAFQAYEFESTFMQRLLSSRTQYEWIVALYRENEHLRVGGATNAWLYTVAKAQRKITKQKKPFDCPTLFIKASFDEVISNQAIDKHINSLYKKSTHSPKVIELPARHGVHIENSDLFYNGLIPEVLKFLSAPTSQKDCQY